MKEKIVKSIQGIPCLKEQTIPTIVAHTLLGIVINKNGILTRQKFTPNEQLL